VAVAPYPCTSAAIGGLLCLLQICMETGLSIGTVPVDDRCCGCGPSLCSCGCACPPCLGYFRHMFGVDSHAAVGLMASAPAASAMRDR
jgi:hypothetical protein